MAVQNPDFPDFPCKFALWDFASTAARVPIPERRSHYRDWQLCILRLPVNLQDAPSAAISTQYYHMGQSSWFVVLI